MAVWFFTPNTQVENWSPETGHVTGDPGGKFAWRWVAYFVKFAYGISVYQDKSGVWHEQRYPGIEETNQANWFYPGGHVSVVSDANKAAMEAALPDITDANFTLADPTTPLTPPPTGDNNQPVPPVYQANN